MFGPDANPAPDGFVVDQNSGYTLVDPVAVIGPDGTQLTVVYAGRSAAGVGVDALQFQLPASLPSGPLMPLKIRVNGQDSNTVSLPIAN